MSFIRSLTPNLLIALIALPLPRVIAEEAVEEGRGHAVDALGLEVLVCVMLKATSSKTKALLFGILHGGLAESSG